MSRRTQERERVARRTLSLATRVTPGDRAPRPAEEEFGVLTSPSATTAERPEEAPTNPGEVSDGARSAELMGGESPFGQGRIQLTIGLMLTIVAVGFQALAVATILPAVVDDLGGLSLYGWAFSAFLLTQLVGIVVSGLLADQRGPALRFALGVLFFTVGLIIGGLAPSMPVLIAARALQGFGGGAIFSTAYVAIGRGYPSSAKPRMLALLSTGWVVPGLIGPAIAGLMAEALGWRSGFLVLAPLLVLAGLLAYPSMRPIPAGSPSPNAKSRLLSAITLSVGAGLILATIGIGNLLVAVLLLVAGLALAIPSMGKLLPAGTLRAAPGMPAAVATMGLLNLAFFGVDAFVPLAFVDVRGASVAFAGLALTAGTIAWSSGSWIQARTSARVSRRTMERIGLSFLALGVVLTAAVLSPQAPLALGPIAWGSAGLGMGLSYITLNLTMLELAPPGQEGNASSSMQLTSVLGSALGAGIGGALIALTQSRGESISRGLLLHDGLMFAAIVLAFVAARGLPGKPGPSSVAAGS